MKTPNWNETTKLNSSKSWDELKKGGSNHYKSDGGVQPIDLYRSVKPHPSLSAFAVKALTDNIKYSYRMLTKGVNESDCGKVTHYTALTLAEFLEVQSAGFISDRHKPFYECPDEWKNGG